MPGVVAVLAAGDLPIATHRTATGPPSRSRGRRWSSPGSPSRIVVAESEAAAEDGAEAVVVEYEPLEAVLDVEAGDGSRARRSRAASRSAGEGGDLESIHAGVDEGEEAADEESSSPANVVGLVNRSAGDVAAALEASDAVVSATFRTPWVYQAYLEPQVCTAWLEPGGSLVVSTSTQGSFVTRSELARAFDLPLDRIRVVAEPLGGAFGGKFALVEPLAAGAALVAPAAGAPRAHPRARTSRRRTRLRRRSRVSESGGRKDGTLTGIEARMVVDRGSNAGWGVEGITSLLVAGPYRWEAHDLRGYGVQTNRFTFGAYRAPRGPDRSLRRRVAARRAGGRARGSTRSSCASRTPSSRATSASAAAPSRSIGAVEVLERVREHPLWQERGSLPEDEGVGVAAGYWPGGDRAGRRRLPRGQRTGR